VVSIVNILLKSHAYVHMYSYNGPNPGSLA